MDTTTQEYIPLEWSDNVEINIKKYSSYWCKKTGVRSIEMIKDVTNEAVLNGFIACSKGKVKSNGCLSFIARNALYDHLSKHFKVKTVPIESTTQFNDDSSIKLGLEDMLITRDFTDGFCLKEAIKQTHPEFLQLFNLRDQGFTWEEIAENLNTPCATLRTKYSRMLKNVRAEYGNQNDSVECV